MRESSKVRCGRNSAYNVFNEEALRKPGAREGKLGARPQSIRECTVSNFIVYEQGKIFCRTILLIERESSSARKHP